MRLADTLKRFFLAWLAAVASTLVCLWQGRSDIDPRCPMSLFGVLRHGCGVVTVLCVTWLWFEAVRMVISPAGFRQTIHWPRVHLQRRLEKLGWFERV